MKLFLFSFFAILFILSLSAAAQAPNGDFELWDNGEPVGWLTNNDIGVGVKVTQTQDAHGGSSALKGEAISYNNNVQGPLVQAGETGKGFLVTQKYANLTGYYKMNSSYNDILIIVIGMYSNGKYIGVGGGSAFTDASSYTNFVIPIYYAYSDIPDSCLISISITNDTAWVHAGTTFYLDDITLQGNAASVKQVSQISSYELYQNYPNPFNPTTNITYQLPEDGFVTLKIYDMLGSEVKTLLNEEKSSGKYIVQFDGSGLASGVYVYQLIVTPAAGDFTNKYFSSTKKLILLQ